MVLHKIAEPGELTPGTSKIVRVAGQDLALFNVDGNFYCIDNECPHMYGPLGMGDLTGDVVMCPLHGWEINVRTGDVVYPGGDCVRTYACNVNEEGVFVEMG